jgi:hypothetical protein
MPTKNDATGDSVAVEYNGETYQVPPTEEWDLAVLEAIDENKMTTALRALLGADQYVTFRKTNTKVKALGEFMDVAGKAVNAGN